MSVEQCIEAYCKLAKVVFNPKKRPGSIKKLFKAGIGRELFDSAVMEKAIKNIVLEQCQDAEELLLGSSTQGCKVLVYYIT